MHVSPLIWSLQLIDKIVLIDTYISNVVFLIPFLQGVNAFIKMFKLTLQALEEAQLKCIDMKQGI